MKKYILFFLMVSISITLVSFIQQDPHAWKVPEKYQKMKNPAKPDSTSLKIGKEMYERYCLACHGTEGKGDGKRAVKLNVQPGDFTTVSFSKETDGAVFYKTTTGHNDMPSFKRRIPSNDDLIEGSFGKTGSVGDLINYIRTLNKNK